MRSKGKFKFQRQKKLMNIKKQKTKYSLAVDNVIADSDVILEILDSRFIGETRNQEIEKIITNKNKQLIFVFNKIDLVEKIPEEITLKLRPHAKISVKTRKGLKNLRQLIKIQASKVKNPIDSKKVTIGIIGYPNTGKSSMINFLIGRGSAKTGAEAGVTKGVQKLKLTENLQLLDSPGLISKKDYSTSLSKKISAQTKVGGRSPTKLKDPGVVLIDIMEEFPEALEKHYKIDSKGDFDKFIEEFGTKRGMLKKGGEADEDKIARAILRDWQAGKIKV